MFQLSHMTAKEALVLQGALWTLDTDPVRVFWSTTQTNTNDWHCRIADPSPLEVQALTALMRGGYGNVEGERWSTETNVLPVEEGS
jgi:hypothetical protein